MLICKALLKHGHINFSLEILEYCQPSQVLPIEDKYFKLLKPSYNILKKAGGEAHSLGYKHLEETKLKISAARIGEKNPMFGKPKPIGSGKLAKAIKVFDKETNETTYYSSINEAAIALNISQPSISYNLKSKKQKPYKGRYVFTKI
jgi:hypothetical protein